MYQHEGKMMTQCEVHRSAPKLYVYQGSFLEIFHDNYDPIHRFFPLVAAMLQPVCLRIVHMVGCKRLVGRPSLLMPEGRRLKQNEIMRTVNNSV